MDFEVGTYKSSSSTVTVLSSSKILTTSLYRFAARTTYNLPVVLAAIVILGWGGSSEVGLGRSDTTDT